MSKWSLRDGALIRAATLMALASSIGCGGDELTEEEVQELAAFELDAAVIPSSPTNAYADVPEAAQLGRTLFFDRRLSSDGTVACADCHDPAQGFSDPRRMSEGVQGREGARHSMPITTAAMQPFLLWDGRADNVWRQPLYALENEREMDFTRSDVALFVSENLREEYEGVFGPMPDLTGVPARARPGDPAWEALPAESRDAVQRVFVNVGKSIEAYERLLVCKDTRFDRWTRGEIQLTERELEGAERFLGNRCDGCHSGPAFSDGKFHNLGLIRGDAATIDTGREAGLAALFADELNGAGVYSDDPKAGASRIALAATEDATLGAFRTASLRGVTQRPRFGHLGEETSLEGFIEQTYRRGRGGRGGGRGDGDGDGNGNGNGNGGAEIVGELDSLLDRVNPGGDDVDAIVEFLRTLECPELPEELLAP